MCSFLSCFLTFLHYVQNSALVIGVGWLRRVGHSEGRKKKKEAKGKGHSGIGELKKINWLKQSQDKLACIYCDLM